MLATTLLALLTPVSLADPGPQPEGAHLVIDAKVPVEILVGGVKLGELYYPGEARFRLVPGHHALRLYTNGQPTDVSLDLTAGERARVLVGRTGITVDDPGSAPAASKEPVAVAFRFVGSGSTRVVLDGKKLVVEAGQGLLLDLPPGSHPMSVRSSDGTVIWASGALDLEGGDSVVVQVAEGRMPEVSGPGAFRTAD